MGHFTDAIRLPSAKFPEIGTVVEGKVVEIGTSTVPDFDDRGRPSGIKYEDDGTTPLSQVDVTLETYVSGTTELTGVKIVLHTDGAIFFSIGRALAEIGAEDLEVGDSLTVTYTGDGEATAKGRNAPKQYSAVVVKG